MSAQKSGGTSEDAVLRGTLDEALGTLAEVLAAGDTDTLAEVISSLDRCRAELGAGHRARTSSTRWRERASSRRGASPAHARNRAAEQRVAVAALVAMVRETVATIAGDQASLHDIAGRFGRTVRAPRPRSTTSSRFRRSSPRRSRRSSASPSSGGRPGSRRSRTSGRASPSLETQLDRTRREAAIDPLTNVANRRTFERTCREWLGPNRPGLRHGDGRRGRLQDDQRPSRPRGRRPRARHRRRDARALAANRRPGGAAGRRRVRDPGGVPDAAAGRGTFWRHRPRGPERVPPARPGWPDAVDQHGRRGVLGRRHAGKPAAARRRGALPGEEATARDVSPRRRVRSSAICGKNAEAHRR